MIFSIELSRLSFIIDVHLLTALLSRGLGKRNNNHFIFPVIEVLGANNWNLLCHQLLVRGYDNIMITD